MTDQQRADSVGYARHGDTDTPHLDALARSGTVFDAAYSASTVCVPARTSLLTGLFDHRVPRVPDGLALQEGCWTIARELAAAGYETALFGKMHFSPLNARHGFEVVRSCEHLTTNAGYSFDAMDDYRRWLSSLGLADPLRDGMAVFPHDERLHATSWITREAIDFLGHRDAERPYFAVVSYVNPHTPLDPPERYASMYDPSREELPPDRFDAHSALPNVFAAAFQRVPGDIFWPERVSVWPPESARLRLSLVRALIRQIDDAVADLVARVSLADTVVLFTSDHGDYNGHRGLFGKVPWIPFDDLARVPLFCAGAGVAGGRRISTLVQSCDLALTCLELAGCSTPDLLFDTQSLAEVLRGGAPDPNRPAFSAISMGWPMIRKGRFKYLRHWAGDEVLFDLVADPLEQQNIVAHHRDVAEELRERLAAQVSRPPIDLKACAPRTLSET